MIQHLMVYSTCYAKGMLILPIAANAIKRISFKHVCSCRRQSACAERKQRASSTTQSALNVKLPCLTASSRLCLATTAFKGFITFAALALHEHPESRAQLQARLHAEGGNEYAEWFAQEVRRFYPFFPFVVAHVRKDFIWNDYHFEQGTRVLLDLYGTNHDTRLWDNPNRFWPERFQNQPVTPFNLIPQGGGDYSIHHRCAGEWITLALMKSALKMLVNGMHFSVPEQNLHFSLTQFPPLPQSRFIIREVKRTTAAVPGTV